MHQERSNRADRNKATKAASHDPFRLPPQNLEAERGVIGGILLDNAVLHEIAAILKPDDFYRDTHQILFRRILGLYAESKAVDAITLVEELERQGEFARVGGHDAMAEILDNVFIACNAGFYAKIVKDKARLRTIITAATQMMRDAYSNERSADDVLEGAERIIFELSSQTAGTNVESYAEILPRVLEAIEKRQGGEVVGIESGFPDLDYLTGGFRDGQLIILAARPSHGKSALSANVVEHAASFQKKSALFVSLEMSRESLVERSLSARSRVDSHRIRTGFTLSARDLGQIGEADRELRGVPVFIDDTPAQSMLQIISTARRIKMRHGLGMVVVDYLQLINGAGEGDSRQEQVGAISRRLKAMARELQVPVLALSQLNRECEKREDKRPVLSDLKDSGSIEQDADIVILLHRPDRYDPNDQPGIAILDVAKNREGATGACKLVFRKELTRFESLDTRHGDPPPEAFGPAPECEEPFG